MGLLDKLRGEFIDIIEWTEPSNNDILCYRFPRYNNEIKNGAKLVVREGQAAVFIKEGQLADVKTPGMYTLDTNNMPILSTILGWKYGFESPFKCEVYFVSTKQWTDKKWGTQNPFMIRDPEFGPVRVRAFGTYAFKVSDPGTFLRQLVATDPSFETYEIANQLRNAIVSRFVDVIGQSKIAILDLAGNYEKVGSLARERISPEMQARLNPCPDAGHLLVKAGGHSSSSGSWEMLGRPRSREASWTWRSGPSAAGRWHDAEQQLDVDGMWAALESTNVRCHQLRSATLQQPKACV